MHINILTKAIVEASISIMEVYKSDFSARYKTDGSPVTLADKQADAIIRRHLQQTCIPVISEESDLLPYESRRNWTQLWLVDPLDGTKEFINRNGEFTVNIALIENGKPILGVIAAPADGRAWIGAAGLGVDMIDNIYDEHLIGVPEGFSGKLNASAPIKTELNHDMIRFAVSRSHPDNQTEKLTSYLKGQGKLISMVPRGSSLKLCEIAMGRADVYPRFGTTMEWDIAAGHAILKAAGGDVINMQTGEPLIYNKPEMQNPHFLATREKHPGELLTMIKQWRASSAV